MFKACSDKKVYVQFISSVVGFALHEVIVTADYTFEPPNIFNEENFIDYICISNYDIDVALNNGLTVNQINYYREVIERHADIIHNFIIHSLESSDTFYKYLRDIRRR